MDFVPIFYCDRLATIFLPQVNFEKVDVDLIMHGMQDDFSFFTTEYVKIRFQLQILC